MNIFSSSHHTWQQSIETMSSQKEKNYARGSLAESLGTFSAIWILWTFSLKWAQFERKSDQPHSGENLPLQSKNILVSLGNSKDGNSIIISDRQVCLLKFCFELTSVCIELTLDVHLIDFDLILLKQLCFETTRQQWHCFSFTTCILMTLISSSSASLSILLNCCSSRKCFGKMVFLVYTLFTQCSYPALDISFSTVDTCTCRT